MSIGTTIATWLQLSFGIMIAAFVPCDIKNAKAVIVYLDKNRSADAIVSQNNNISNAIAYCDEGTSNKCAISCWNKNSIKGAIIY